MKETLCEGKFLRFVRAGAYEFVERSRGMDVVAVVPITDEGKIVLVEQYRRPIDMRAIEIPAGLVNDTERSKGETLEDAAHRELIEETGYAASRLDHLGRWPTSAGMSAETVAVFLGTGLKKVGPGGGDDAESITVHEVPIADAGAWLRWMQEKGFAIDVKIYLGLYLQSPTLQMKKGPS